MPDPKSHPLTIKVYCPQSMLTFQILCVCAYLHKVKVRIGWEGKLVNWRAVHLVLLLVKWTVGMTQIGQKLLGKEIRCGFSVSLSPWFSYYSPPPLSPSFSLSLLFPFFLLSAFECPILEVVCVENLAFKKNLSFQHSHICFIPISSWIDLPSLEVPFSFGSRVEYCSHSALNLMNLMLILGNHFTHLYVTYRKHTFVYNWPQNRVK